jgi:hypothetical protein
MQISSAKWKKMRAMLSLQSEKAENADTAPNVIRKCYHGSIAPTF